MKTRTLALLIAAMAVAACSDTMLEPGNATFSQAGGRGTVSVLSQNLYVGTDVDAVIAALMSPAPTDDVPALFSAIETLQRTDFPTRAAGIANAIARERPDVIGLQELSEIHIDLTGLGFPVVIDLEFLPIIQAQLAARGLTYAVAATIKNIDAQPVPGIRLVDYDAILVNADRVTVESAEGKLFAANVGPIAPGVSLQRGYVQVLGTIDGRRYRFVNTHLEPNLGAIDLSALRAGQVLELMTTVFTDDTPGFVMGDLNDVEGSPMYQVLTGAGFTDVWRALRPGVAGNTNPRSADLSDPNEKLTKRIDYVFARGLGGTNAGLQGRISLIGAQPSEMVQGPVSRLWLSDHAGVFARLLAQ